MSASETASQRELVVHLPPPKLAGTTIRRTVLSALAETSKVPVGLNLSAVGGKEWECKILSWG